MTLLVDLHRFVEINGQPGAWDFGWAALAAIASILAAGATVWAVLTALKTAREGRLSAEGIAAADRAASETALQAQLDAATHARRMERQTDILLRLIDVAGEHRANQKDARIVAECRVKGAALAYSLESAVHVPWTRLVYLGDERVFIGLEGRPTTVNETFAKLIEELGGAIALLNE